MPTNTLTDNDCRKAAPRDKGYKLFDGNGLFLWVSPKGAKVWRQAYRFAGKPDTLVHGAYPLITLKGARELRDEALRKLAAGVDPKADAKPMPAPVEGVKDIALLTGSEVYWDGKQDIGDDYRSNAKRGIELHLGPTLGERDMRTITRDDLLECLNAMNAAGKYVYVRKVRMWASQVWHWAVEQKYADTNVPDTINPKRAFGKKKVVSFAALHERDFPSFWKRLDFEGEIQSVLAARMLAYTWVRTKELRFMEWAEVDAFAGLLAGRARSLPDPSKDWTWEVPEGKMKKAKALVVPMPRQARELLLKLWARRRPLSPYVFPAEHRDDRPMSDSTVLMLIYRLGYKGEMTGHGFRSVGSTWANERGYNWDHIERQLAHVPENKVRGVYNKAEYLGGRRKLLQDLADWIESLDSKAAEGDSTLLAA